MVFWGPDLAGPSCEVEGQREKGGEEAGNGRGAKHLRRACEYRFGSWTAPSLPSWTLDLAKGVAEWLSGLSGFQRPLKGVGEKMRLVRVLQAHRKSR